MPGALRRWGGACAQGGAGRLQSAPLPFELTLRAHLPGCPRSRASRAAAWPWPAEAMARPHRGLLELNSAHRAPTGSEGKEGGGGRGVFRTVSARHASQNPAAEDPAGPAYRPSWAACTHSPALRADPKCGALASLRLRGGGDRWEVMRTPSSRHSSVTCPTSGAGPATVQRRGFETPALKPLGVHSPAVGGGGSGSVHRTTAQLAGCMPPRPCGISINTVCTAGCSVASRTPSARHCSRGQQCCPCRDAALPSSSLGRVIAWRTAHGPDRGGTEVQTGREAEGRGGHHAWLGAHWPSRPHHQDHILRQARGQRLYGASQGLDRILTWS